MIQKHKYKIIAIILLFGFLIRLYKINNPIADWHSWRQADTSAVTRNFVKMGLNMLYPKFDDFSNVSNKGFNPEGYRYVEFPIFNLIHYTLYISSPQILTDSLRFTGSALDQLYLYVESKGWYKMDIGWPNSTDGSLEFWGRMTSVISSLFSAFLLFKLIEKKASTSTGILAAMFFYFLPYNVYFTRVILPDPMMVTFFLASLFAYENFRSTNKIYWLITTALLGAIAVLIKPVAIFFLLPITFIQLKKYRLNFYKTPEFIFCHFIFVLPFLSWRLWSHRHPEGIPESNWLINGNGIRFKPAFFQWMAGNRVGNLILGKWGIWAFMSGVISANKYIFALLLSSAFYIIFFATGNVQHDYYQIAIIPAISSALAVGCISLWKGVSGLTITLNKRILLIVSLVFMFSFSWIEVKGLYQVNNWSIVHAGVAADKLLSQNARVIAPYQGDTAFLYQTNRRGFAYVYQPIKDRIDLNGVMYYISTNYDATTNDIINKYTVLVKNPEYVIVKLEEKLNR